MNVTVEKVSQPAENTLLFRINSQSENYQKVPFVI